LAAEHLLALAHTRIAFIAGPAGNLHARLRLDGAQAALSERGIQPFAVAHGDFSYGSGASAAMPWCKLTPVRRPTAILCINDAMALGALSTASGHGVRVPIDISVTGYDDVPQARYAVPPLTTVAQPIQQLATTALERLLDRIANPGEAAEPQRHVFPVKLVVRRSTAQLLGR
jgi:DNA-binding LacI/PurR family transcriptional regulator